MLYNCIFYDETCGMNCSAGNRVERCEMDIEESVSPIICKKCGHENSIGNNICLFCKNEF